MSSEETKIAIDALLSLGSDLPSEDDITKENATLMPISNIAVPQSANSSDMNGDNNANLQVVPDQSTSPTPAPTPTPQRKSTTTTSGGQNDTSESTDSQTRIHLAARKKVHWLQKVLLCL